MAIKVEELRTRNWVKSVVSGEEFTLPTSELIYIADNPDNYEPIPLTNEWLVKFGLFADLKDGTFLELNFFESFSFAFLRSTPNELGLFYGDEWTGTKIQYVHQLQNLHYTLTGHELTA